MTDIFNTLPDDDQGSEAIAGFDYQFHCVASLCLDMVMDTHITETICEHYEDIVQKHGDKSPCFCQVKKREATDTWTFSTVKDGLHKLLEKVQFKNVGGLVLYGNGRASSKDELNLAGLINLLDRPQDERDLDWQAALVPYEQHICEKIFKNEFDLEIVQKGLRLLKIDLTMPHPEAIEYHNKARMNEAITSIWEVEVSQNVVNDAYKALFDLGYRASNQPKQPRSQKTISAMQARTVIRRTLEKHELLAKSPQMLIDTQTKLAKGQLSEQLPYVLQMRMNAQETKMVLGINSTDWHDCKSQIAVAWNRFTSTNGDLIGPEMWKEVRTVLRDIGEGWASHSGNIDLGPAFAEGVFFDMVATCSVHFRI